MSDDTAANDTDVVISGAGPTGLMAAALLARCGVRVRIFDKSDQQAHETRAFAVHAKSLELMLSIGLADEFLNHGLIASGVQLYVEGKRAAELNFVDLHRIDTPYSFVLMVPQYDIEAILARDVERRGVRIEHKVEVTGFVQSADGVTVFTRDAAGATSESRARYLIGADGAHSVVRKALGLRFDGAPYPQAFLLADCQIDWPLDYDHLKLFLHGRNLAAYLPLKGRDICRLIVIEPPSEGPEDDSADAVGTQPLTLPEVEAAVRAASGMEIKLSNPTWLSRYRIHHRGVNKYGEGRAFVAGDAAHIHSPAGGQGMNTGLQDAANLAWKLAVVLKGSAPDSLLDTYNSERWPVGQKILKFTDRLFASLASQNPWMAGLRNALVPLFAGTVSRSGMARGRVFHFVSQLGIRYHDNASLRDDFSPNAPRSWRAGLTAGRRAPNGLFARNQDVFSLIDGYRFHVLAFSRKPLSREEIERLANDLAALPKFAGLPIYVHIIAHSLVGRDNRIHQAESNQAFDVYGLSHDVPQALFLVRPDGYIAYRSDRLEMGGLREFLREQFGAATSGVS